MSLLRGALLPVGVLLMILGFGNWYTGVDKGAEYERLLAAGDLPTMADDYEDFDHLTARTTATLLDPLQRGSDGYTLANAKLDFYRVVQSGGRLFVLFGLFCTAAGLIRSWLRRQRPEQHAVTLPPR